MSRDRSRGAPHPRPILGPDGSPLRRKLLAQSERVLWKFPDVPADPKWAHLSRRDAGERFEAEESGLVEEVRRIHGRYVDDFIECMKHHEHVRNRGRMPQVTIPTPNGRTGVEHLAQMTFYVKWGEEVINATEEADLLHPDRDVGRVVSLPGRKAD